LSASFREDCASAFLQNWTRLDVSTTAPEPPEYRIPIRYSPGAGTFLPHQHQDVFDRRLALPPRKVCATVRRLLAILQVHAAMRLLCFRIKGIGLSLVPATKWPQSRLMALPADCSNTASHAVMLAWVCAL
jgi:hypothetical protein